MAPGVIWKTKFSLNHNDFNSRSITSEFVENLFRISIICMLFSHFFMLFPHKNKICVCNFYWPESCVQIYKRPEFSFLSIWRYEPNKNLVCFQFEENKEYLIHKEISAMRIKICHKHLFCFGFSNVDCIRKKKQKSNSKNRKSIEYSGAHLI